MIALNQEQRLGRTAYFYLVAKRTNAGFAVILVALILLVAKGLLGVYLVQALALANVRNAGMLTATILDWLTAILVIIGLLACLVGVIIARLEYGNYTFTFEEFDLRLKHGIIWLTEVSIPYRSMQDINLDRNLIHRLTNTSRVIIDSAGHEEAETQNETDILLDPIDKDAAEEIRLMLQRKVGVQVVENEREADKEAGSAKDPF